MFFLKKKNIEKNSFLKIPKHIAIIMDGNARWAKSKNLPIQIGHKNGADNLQKICESCIDLGVEFLTVYAFSSENWNRPKEEVEYLMRLLEEYLDKETKPLNEKGIRISISGNIDKISDNLRKKINDVEEITKNNQKLKLNVAFSYGARQEIVDAVKKIVAENNPIESIDEKLISEKLYRPEMPDPDLLIRTAGDHRISNFLLWQIAYCELYFTEKFWPDFGKDDLLEAIKNFNQRERRYGKR